MWGVFVEAKWPAYVSTWGRIRLSVVLDFEFPFRIWFWDFDRGHMTLLRIHVRNQIQRSSKKWMAWRPFVWETSYNLWGLDIIDILWMSGYGHKRFLLGECPDMEIRYLEHVRIWTWETLNMSGFGHEIFLEMSGFGQAVIFVENVRIWTYDNFLWGMSGYGHTILLIISGFGHMILWKSPDMDIRIFIGEYVRIWTYGLLLGRMSGFGHMNF